MSEHYGLCVSGPKAIELLELYQDNFPEEIKTEEFCREYESVLNRVRYAINRQVPVAPKVTEAKVKSYGRFYNCGECGFGLRTDIYKCCPNCGRQIKWSSVYPERWP